LYHQEEDKFHKEGDELLQDKRQTSRIATYRCQKKMTRRGARAHQPTTFSYNHICTQTTRGVRTFIQWIKPKKTIVLEKDEVASIEWPCWELKLESTRLVKLLEPKTLIGDVAWFFLVTQTCPYP
jgi:hypothetical protein